MSWRDRLLWAWLRLNDRIRADLCNWRFGHCWTWPECMPLAVHDDIARWCCFTTCTRCGIAARSMFAVTQKARETMRWDIVEHEKQRHIRMLITHFHIKATPVLR